MLSYSMISPPLTAPTARNPSASHRNTLRPIISPANPLESTLPRPSASVQSKPLAASRFPLESTLTKKPGVGLLLWLIRNPAKDFCPEEHRDEGPLFNPPWFFCPRRPSPARDLSSPATASPPQSSAPAASDPAGKSVRAYDRRSVFRFHMVRVTSRPSAPASLACFADAPLRSKMVRC